MNKLNAILIDSREPAWVQALDFNAPKMNGPCEAGDAWAITSDEYTLIIERKTPDDFLQSLKDGRLFEQVRRLGEYRYQAQLKGEKPTMLPYLVITGAFTPGSDGKVYTSRQTGWSFAAVMGAILSIQEAGVYVVFCNGDNDYRDCILRLASRDRSETLDILPQRPIELLGPKETVVASLPGIGIERAKAALEWGGWHLGWTLVGLTDPSLEKSPVPRTVRANIRALFGLGADEELTIISK
jgi:ERCC4-type nuclease